MENVMFTLSRLMKALLEHSRSHLPPTCWDPKDIKRQEQWIYSSKMNVGGEKATGFRQVTQREI